MLIRKVRSGRDFIIDHASWRQLSASGRKKSEVVQVYGTPWCRYYASKGYLTASLNYTLQKHNEDATLGKMGEEIENAVAAISDYTKTAGIQIADMAVCGVSAGGTLAMNFAYRGRSEIPVRFVFQLAAPTYFAADEWELLKKVDGLESDDEFYRI